jgi:hypothetical protein
LALFDVTFTHAPLQSRVPAGHSQRPDVHTPPGMQTTPQPPQLLRSVPVFTQLPLQFVCMPQPRKLQLPLLHAPDEQCVPHAPQLFGSESNRVSQPFDATPSQSAQPASQTSAQVGRAALWQWPLACGAP